MLYNEIERSYARSLEELPTTPGDIFPSGGDKRDGAGSEGDEGDGVGPPSLPLMSSLPLAR